MLSSKIISFCKTIVLLGVVIATSYYFGSYQGRKKVLSDVTPKRDTLFIRDTFYQKAPPPKVVSTDGLILVHLRDELIYGDLPSKLDTIISRDTVFIQLPHERKVYVDSTYYAVVSGFKPTLDYIEVYHNTRVITEVKTIKKQPRLVVGPSLGVGISAAGQFQPYLGITATVPIWSW